MGFKVEYVAGDSVHIELDGEFGLADRQSFIRQLLDMPAAARYTISLANATAIDSSGFGLLLLLRDHASQRAITIQDVPGRIREPLERMNLHRIFDVV